MLEDVQKIDLTRRDIELIEAALATQEKILAVQSRAGGRSARARLNDLKSLMRRFRRIGDLTPEAKTESGWTTRLTRSFFF